MNHHQTRRGYALIVVLSVLAILIVYLATVQSSVSMTHRLGKLGAVRQDLHESTASLITLALASGVTTGQTLEAAGGLKARVTVLPLAATDAAWKDIPAIALRPGDALLTIEWQMAVPPTTPTRFLVNRQGLRTGAIALGIARGKVAGKS